MLAYGDEIMNVAPRPRLYRVSDIDVEINEWLLDEVAEDPFPAPIPEELDPDLAEDFDEGAYFFDEDDEQEGEDLDEDFEGIEEDLYQ